MDLVNEVKRFYKTSDAVIQLICINVAVFLLYHIANLFFYLFAISDHFSLYYWLAAPTNLQELLLRPWTLFTYMFFHTDFFHLLFNMLWLYWFGRIFRLYLSKKLLFNVYLLGGLAGVLFFIITYNVFPVFSVAKYAATILGASASVLAIVLAISCYVPRYTVHLLFLGPVRLIYIAAFSVVLDIVYISMSNNAGGHIAHLGGALFGFLFASNIQKGKDITAWFSRIYGKIGSWFRPKSKMRVHYRKPPTDDREYNRQKNVNQTEIDHILDKISTGGYDSLSKKEKETLFNQKP